MTKYIRLGEEPLPSDCIRAIELIPGDSIESKRLRNKLSKGIAKGKLRSIRVEKFLIDRATNTTQIQYSHPYLYRDEAEAFLAESVESQGELQFENTPQNEVAEALAKYQRDLSKMLVNVNQMLESQEQMLEMQRQALGILSRSTGIISANTK